MTYPDNNGQYDSTVYNGKCPNTCASDSSIQWGNKMTVSSFDNLNAQYDGIPAIQKEIMTNGPVQTGFTVYKDFFN